MQGKGRRSAGEIREITGELNYLVISIKTLPVPTVRTWGTDMYIPIPR